MEKVKLIVHESYQGKKDLETVFVDAYLSNTTALTENTKLNKIKMTNQFQDSLCSEKGAFNGTSEE